MNNLSINQTNSDCADDYYDELLRSAEHLFELGIEVVPSINYSSPSGEFTGLDELHDFQDSLGLSDADPADFGLEGTEICGDWSSDDKFFNGFFATHICDDGNYRITRPSFDYTLENVHSTIRLAKKFNFGNQFGISASTNSFKHCMNSGCMDPNAILVTNKFELNNCPLPKDLRIEYNGLEIWTYAYVNFKDDFFAGFSREGTYGCTTSPLEVTIVKYGIRPCYPSIVSNRRIQLFNPIFNSKIYMINSKADFNKFAAKLRDYEIIEDEKDPHDFCISPEEDEQCFQLAIKAFEAERLKFNHKQSNDNLNASVNNAIKCAQNEIQINEIFPPKVANALSLLSKSFPYDDISVAMAFITGAAGMVKLGTKVEGSRATRYLVPINFYTALVAKSGRKKSPLQNSFVRNPATSVLSEVAKQNDNIYKNWQESSRGKTKDDKPPKPVPIDLRISDYTAEALVITLKRNDELGLPLLIERDEINGLFNSLNMYKGGKGADEQQLLELYDGGAYRSIRQSDSTRGFQRSAVSIFGAVQPEILFDLISSGDASGKWARFIFVPLPDNTKQLPINFSDEMNAELDKQENLLQDVMYSIYRQNKVTYRLDNKAIKLFSEYEFGKQNDVQSAELSAQSSLYGKSAGKVLRLAGILHILWNYDNNNCQSTEICIKTLNIAIKIIDYLDCWMLAMHANVAGTHHNKLDSFAKRIHDIALKSNASVSWTEIRNHMSSVEKSGKTKPDAEKSMQALVEMNLGEISIGDRGGLYYKAIKTF
ncbi:MAG: DUF3987 domain-containing protein [Betaproteobacteria bacterium]|nr:DUF3987 domain-containing protein [Betaproteobacteria bacterium]